MTEDLIKREDVLKLVKKWVNEGRYDDSQYYFEEAVIEEINQLPSQKVTKLSLKFEPQEEVKT